MLRSLVVLAVTATLLFIPLRGANAACDIAPFVGALVPTKTLLMVTSGSSTLIRNQTHTCTASAWAHRSGNDLGRSWSQELEAAGSRSWGVPPSSWPRRC